MLAFDLSPGGIPKLNVDWRWENQEQVVLSACSSLVSVITDKGSRIVQFSHFSVKEFLMSDRLTSCTEVSQFYIPIEPSHMILAQACLGTLLCLDDRTDKDGAWKIPLYQYAAKYWVGHAQFGNVEFKIKDTMDYFFDTDKPHFSAWLRLERPYDLFTVSMNQGPRDVLSSAAPLYFAAWRGFRGLVERLIVKNPQQIHHLGGVYGTPFNASVHGGHIEVAQLLFEHGADINSRSADNWTPLHIASLASRLEIGKWLLDQGADVNSQQNRGLTPLHFVASEGHLGCQILLQVEHKVDINSLDYRGATPLLCVCALEGGKPDVLRLLLDRNADVHMRDDEGNTSLHFAASHGHPEVARMLLERNAEVNTRNNDGSTPLLRALGARNPDAVWFLLDYNADVHMHDNEGNTPLQRAARNGLLNVSRKLLDRNADVNSCNHHGSTPLLLASENGHADVVQLLLDYGADVYARDGDGDTALHCAALGGSLDVSRILLRHNLEVNFRNNDGSTPLHLVSERRKKGTPDVVQLLLDYGADVQVRNLSGKTASELARDREEHDIVQLLSRHPAE